MLVPLPKENKTGSPSTCSTAFAFSAIGIASEGREVQVDATEFPTGGVGVTEGVGVGVIDGVGVGVSEGVGVGVIDGVGVGVSEGVGVGVIDGVGVGVTDGVGVGVIDGDGVGVTEGVGVADGEDAQYSSIPTKRGLFTFRTSDTMSVLAPATTGTTASLTNKRLIPPDSLAMSMFGNTICGYELESNATSIIQKARK